MTRGIAIGWDEAARQGREAMRGQQSPTFTERGALTKDEGWEGATAGCEKRVAMKLGRLSPNTHKLSGVPWSGRIARK